MSAENKPTVDDDDSVSLLDVIEEESRMQEDASAVLGGSDDKECTYSKGYVKRQALYACSTCSTSEPAGICLACSYHCHEGHDLYELYTKRHFRCDCGNSKFKDVICKLESTKAAVNEENQYNQNFKGLYCTCARPYPDPEDEIDDDMIQCMVCEDWFHGRHLGTEIPENDSYQEMICGGCMAKHPSLWAYQVSRSAEKVKKESMGDEEEKVDIGGGEGEAAKPTSPSKPAVQPTATAKPEKSTEAGTENTTEAGTEKPTEAGAENTSKVGTENTTEAGTENTSQTGTKNTSKAGTENITEAGTENTSQAAKEEPAAMAEKTQHSSQPIKGDQPDRCGEKRKRECSPPAAGSSSAGTSASAALKSESSPKRARTVDTEASSSSSSSISLGSDGGCLLEDLEKRKVEVGACAAFWPQGWRDKLCSCTKCRAMYKEQGLDFLLDAEDTVSAYEEKGRNSAQPKVSDMEILSGMSHTQKIEMVNGFNDMKTELSEFLKGFAENKQVVTSSDIKAFFEGLEKRRKERQAGGEMQYFCK